MRKLALLVVAGLLGAAITKELRTPAGQRSWVGKLGGVVPYDLRRPTAGRLASRVWAPEDPRILTPHGFGVGWTVNVGRIVRLALRSRPSGGASHS